MNGNIFIWSKAKCLFRKNFCYPNRYLIRFFCTFIISRLWIFFVIAIKKLLRLINRNIALNIF